MDEDPIRAAYASDLERLRQRFILGRQRVVIPEAVGLHRRRPGAHFHATPEFFLQTGGATDFECPGGSFRLRPGDVCVVPAGVPHAETPIDLGAPYGVIVVMQQTDDCVLVRGWSDRARRIQSGSVIHCQRANHAFRCLEEVSGDRAIERPLRRQFVQGLISAFLCSILTGIRRPAKAQSAGCSLLVAETEKLVRVEISRPDLAVASLAARLGCTPDHLTRRFRAERGSTLNAWITRERIALARDLLAKPDHNIAEVGWICGFATPSYFIRVFRSNTGMTPRAWRLLAPGGRV